MWCQEVTAQTCYYATGHKQIETFFASRAWFLLKQRERKRIFRVHRMSRVKIRITKWAKTLQATRSPWGNSLQREYLMKESILLIVPLSIITSLWRPHTERGSWLMRWAFPINWAFSSLKSQFCKTVSYVTGEAQKKTLSNWFFANARMYFIKYICHRNKSKIIQIEFKIGYL